MSSRNIESVYPLSPLQQGMLFHCLCEPESGVYVTQMSCRLGADLDTEAFGRAWQSVVDRHAILRTAFAWEGLDHPVQVVGRRAKLPIHLEDWSELSEAEAGERFERLLVEDRRRGFELRKA